MDMILEGGHKCILSTGLLNFPTKITSCYIICQTCTSNYACNAMSLSSGNVEFIKSH